MIYPSIVTTDGNHFKKLEEATKLGLEEVCFFATQLSLEERKNFYELLERTKIRRIPLVHIRQDFEIWELAYLSKTFSVETFNCHSSQQYPFKNDISAFREKIYIENAGVPLYGEEVKEYAGVCVDFCHLEGEFFLDRQRFENDLKIIETYPLGCGHISAFRKSSLKDYVSHKSDNLHILEDLADVDYLEKYQKYFPPIMALELENSLEEQLKIIDYLSSKTWASKV